jgi:hypothetical protein
VVVDGGEQTWGAARTRQIIPPPIKLKILPLVSHELDISTSR